MTPCHYYQPIPDTRTLKDALWERESELVAINMNEEKQLNLLHQFSCRFKDEYEPVRRDMDSAPIKRQEFFLPGDREIFYSMVRHFGPKKVVEIGSGFTTFLVLQAIRRNAEEHNRAETDECELLAIEPFPDPALDASLPGHVTLLKQKVEDVPLAEFTKLGRNDILFIDSSHVLRTGGDVQYEYLEVLPRLADGVVVHVHDVFFPLEYPRVWLLERKHFFSEQYLLQAFLSFNRAFEVLWASHFMFLRHQGKLESALGLKWQQGSWPPSSFWVRRVE